MEIFVNYKHNELLWAKIKKILQKNSDEDFRVTLRTMYQLKKSNYTLEEEKSATQSLTNY